ncbi:hypothetical protein [Pelagibacterium halotolerans]|uniref:hypothetical protein n=1 Tax=Pelagibacterium halotolerans TaxID=531813 RepID=UPI00384FB4EB
MSQTALAPSSDFGILPDPDAVLTHICASLAAPRRKIEETFLDMGQQLLDSVRLLNEISTAHEGIPAELKSEQFAGIEKTLTAIRDEVLQMSGAHGEEVGCLDRLNAMAQAASTPMHALRKSVRTIKLVAVNARVIASVTQGDQRDLEVFTVDVRDLTQKVDEAVADFAKAYERFAHDLANARSASMAFAERHDGTMTGIVSRLDKHLNSVAAYRQRAAAAAGEHTDLTAQIRARVSQAVSALQIGDMTRQRVEHVEEALAMLVERASGVNVDTHAAAARLLAALLEDAGQDFERQVADLAQTLEDLADDADKVLLAGKSEAATAFSDGEAALGSIVDELAEIRALFRDFAQTRAETEKIAAEVARSVAVMVERLAAIGEIEQSIRLLSFNTAVQCAKLGEEGGALRVIAQSLREIVSETVEASSAILGALDAAESHAQALADGAAAGQARRIAALESAADGAVDLLGQVSGRLRVHVSTMTAVGPQAVKQLNTAAGHAAGQRNLSAVLHAAQAEILALASSEPDLSALDAEFFARLRARYTMDGERQVHDRILDLPPSLDATATAPDEEAALDDVFF